MRGVNDNSGAPAGGPFVASSLSVFLPSIVIIAGYAAVLVALVLAGRSGGALARLCMVVLGLGGPFLLAHALLRRLTVRVDLMPHAAYLNAGFPSLGPVEVEYGRVRSAKVLSGLVGRLAGAGTLVVDLDGGGRAMVADLRGAAAAAAAIEREAAMAKAAATAPVRIAPPRRPGRDEGLAAHF